MEGGREHEDVPESKQETVGVEKQLKESLASKRAELVPKLAHAAVTLEKKDEMTASGKSLAGRARVVVANQLKSKHSPRDENAKKSTVKETIDMFIIKQYTERKWLFWPLFIVALALVILGCFMGSSIKTLFNVFLVSNSFRACESRSVLHYIYCTLRH